MLHFIEVDRKVIGFTVPGDPVAQPRQRHRIVTPGSGRAFATNYTPRKHKVQDFKAMVRLAATELHAGPLILGPIALHITFAFDRPVSVAKAEHWAPGRRWHGRGPIDVDNLAKAVMDALKGVLWKDDTQVCSLHACKVYVRKGESPHTAIALRELSPDNT